MFRCFALQQQQQRMQPALQRFLASCAPSGVHPGPQPCLLALAPPPHPVCPQVSKQPLLPPLLPVVQQGRTSASHSRSSSRSHVDLSKMGGPGMPSMPSGAAAAAAEEAAQRASGANGGASSGVRQPRPRSIAVMTQGAPAEAYEQRWVQSCCHGWGYAAGCLPPPLLLVLLALLLLRLCCCRCRCRCRCCRRPEQRAEELRRAWQDVRFGLHRMLQADGSCPRHLLLAVAAGTTARHTTAEPQAAAASLQCRQSSG